MKFTTTVTLALSALLATPALAALPACEPPNKSGVFYPKKGTVITSSKAFQLYYCSAQYFRSYTTSIDVLLTNSTTLRSGALVASGLTPTPESTSSYLYNLTIPSTATPRGNVYLAVYERFSGYYNPGYNVSYVAVTLQ